MKVVINKCFGGFSISAQAVKLMAELQGKEAYFFTTDFKDPKSKYIPIPIEECDMFFTAFTVPNPNEYLKTDKEWHEMSSQEKDEWNKRYNEVSLELRPEDRTDPLLIQVVEKLGKAADGGCAELAIVEIPDGIEYEIDEYDGIEHIAEKHRTWY